MGNSMKVAGADIINSFEYVLLTINWHIIAR